MPAELRVVLDTNIIISGLISPTGPAGIILKALRSGKFTLVTSQSINNEVLEVMDRPRLRDRYGLAEHLFDITFLLWEVAEVVTNPPPVKISKDPDDDKFISAAIGGLAHYLVTGDIKDLLILREYEDVRIVPPRQFLEIIHGTSH